MKKFIIHVISLLLIFQMLAAPISFASSDKDYAIHGIIGELGIINTEVDSADITVTRKLAALYVARVMNMDAAEKSGSRYFVDVETGDFATNAINNLTASGIITIPEDRRFRPDENISYNELLKMLICALGYDEYAEAAGGWTSGYYRIASSLDLTVNVKDKSKLTVAEAARMIYKALRAPVCEVENIKNGSLTYKSGDLLIEQKKNIHIYKGTVEAVGGMSVTSELSGTPADKIVISGDVYDVKGDRDFSDYIGNYVEFYCREIDDTKEVILIAPDTSGKPQIEINIRDVDEFDGNQLAYYKENSERTTRVNINSPKVVYNGELLTQDVKAVMSSLNKGKVYVKDSKGDGTYDTVIVEDYNSYIVSGISKTEEILYLKNVNKAIDIGDYDFFAAYDDSGNEIDDILSIKNNSVISVMESKNKSFLRILVSSKEFNGTVESLGNDNRDKRYAEINGDKYIIDKTYAVDIEKSMQLRNTYYFRLDAFGDIVSCDFNVSGEYKAGYLLRIFRDDENEKFSVKVFTDDDCAKRFTFADSVTIDGKKCKDFYKISDRVYTIFGVDPDLSLLQPQIVGYKTNDDGEITFIDTATVRDGENSESSLTKVYENDLVERRYSICGSTRTIGRQAIINNTTKVFYIPYGATKIDEDLCRAGSRTTLMIEDRTYYSNVYNFSSLNAYGDVLLVYYTAENIPANSDSRIPVLMFDKKMTTVDEDNEIYQKVYAYDGIEQKTYMVPKDVDLSSIKRGDLISFTYDVHGNVKEGSRVKKYYSCSDSDSPFDTWNERDGSFLYTNGDYRQNFQLSFGKLLKKNENVISLCKNAREGVIDIADLTNKGIAIYDESEDVITVEADGLLDNNTVGEACSRIVMRTQNGQFICAYGYNK